MITPQVVVAFWRWRFETDLDGLPGSGQFAGGEKVQQGSRHVSRNDAESFSFCDYLNAEKILECRSHEVLHRFRIADGLIDRPEVLFNLIGLDGVLGEDASRGDFAPRG